jgi:integrase
MHEERSLRLQDSSISRWIGQARATGQRIELPDHEWKALRLRLTPNGAASWSLLCKDNEGRTRRFLIGGYPGLSLRDARIKARKLRERVRDGYDPIAEKRQRVLLARTAHDTLTMNGLFELYATKGRGAELRSWESQRGRLSAIFRTVIDRDMSGVSLVELQGIIDEYGQKRVTSARWAVSTLRPILKWGAANGRKLISAELVGIVNVRGAIRRQRVLNESELENVWRVLLAMGGDGYADCMRFILLTLLRRSEAENVRWSDVDLDGRVVRVTGTKNGRDHVVPLSDCAMEVLRGRLALRAPGAGLVFSNAVGRVLNGWDRARLIVTNKSGVDGWHCHDLRRTGATLLGEMGIEPYVVEAALNHVNVMSALAATYNVARYGERVREALAMLGERLAGCG